MTGPDTAKFFLRTLGGLSIETDGAAWSGLVNQRKTLGLLALLAVAGDRGVSRDKILAILWPESGSDQARNALAQLVFRIRRELGGDVLSGNAELRLNADLMSSDVSIVQKAASEGQFEAVAQAYSGPFLDGVYIKDAPDFERWAADERQRLEQVFFDALEKLARKSTLEGDRAGVVAWTSRRVAADPLSARAAKSHIEALVAAGDRETALRFGRDYGTLVRTQLETEPDPDITRVLDRIRTSVVAAPSNGVAPDAIPVPTAGVLADNTDAALPRQANPDSGATKRRAIVAALGIPFVAFGLVVMYTAAHEPASSTTNVVLVAPFENAAGDTSFNGIGRVAEAILIEGLQRTGIVGVVDAGMGMAAPTPGDREEVKQAALAGIVARTNAGVVVAGQLFRAGADSLELRARILDARSGRVLNVLNPIRLRPNAPDSALLELRDRVTGALAALIDERLASLREEGAPPPQFAAYQEFVEGIDFFAGKRSARFDYLGSIPHFTRAAQLDTMWNLPLSWLAFAYGNSLSLNRGRLKDSVVDVLERRRDRLAPLDRHALDYFLAQRVHDDKAMDRAVAGAAKLAPASNWTYMHGVREMVRGRDDEAIAAFRTLDGDGGWIQSWIYYRIEYANVLHLRGRSDEELRVAREGVRSNPDPNMYDALFRAFGSRGDVRSLDKLVDSIALLPNANQLHSRTGNSLARAASEASVHGYAEAATHLARRCVDWIEAHAPIGKGPPMDPIERQIALNALGQCLFMLERWDEALTRSVEIAQDQHPAFGPLAMIRQVLIALRQQDTVTANRRIAEAYLLPPFHPDSNNRSLLDALIAASAGDAGGTARHLGQRGRKFWHERVEITPSLRRSREMRALLESR